MKSKPVVDERNLPRKAPVNISFILVVALKAYNAPQWAIGAVGAVILFLWIKYIRDIIMYKERDVNIFRKQQNP